MLQSVKVEGESELVSAAMAGDTAAFARMVQRYRPFAVAVAYRILRDRRDAEDVAQDAFVRVHKHAADFRGTANFRTWLYRIVHNLAIDLLRRRSPWHGIESRADAEDVPDALDPAMALDRTRFIETMQVCLDALPAHHRTAILLREVEGMSYEEIARAMGCPKGTVMSRLFHARRRMQALLAGE